MGFWMMLFLFVTTTVVSALFQKKPQDAKPVGAGEFEMPTAQEGRVIPAIFGTVKIKGPNITWWGDLRTKAIKKKSGGFLGIGGKKVIVGYKYFVGIMFALCHGPVDRLIKIRVGDRNTSESQDSHGDPEEYIDIEINKPEMFGGDEKEGGIEGVGRFYRGTSTQTKNPYLEDEWGHEPSRYRGLCYLVMKRVYVGTSQYLKNWEFELKRCPTPTGMNSGHADIDGDANPAHVIVDVMTNTVWGLGITLARFDLASFTAAASTLHTEGFGISFILDSNHSADSVLADVLRTIDATLYTDPATGLWTLKLIRADYDPATLPSFTVDSAAVPEWSRGSWSETINEVKLMWTDRDNGFRPAMAQFQETANHATQGQVISETLEFRGICKKAIAQKVVAREAKTHSYPLAQFKLILNRSAWKLRPGSPFKFSFNPESGEVFTDMVLRVTSIRYGALEAGEIEVEAVEDIFAIGGTAYDEPGDTEWEEPIADPVPASAVSLFEVPYHLIGEERWVMAVAARGDKSTFGAELWVDETGSGNWFIGNELQSMTPSGVLASSYTVSTPALDTVGFTLAAGGVDLDRLLDETTDAAGRTRGDNLAVFVDSGEIVSWTAATENLDGTYTFSGVLRAVMDTLPADHAAGVRVFFISEGAATTKETAYADDLTVRVKTVTRNALGAIALSAAAQTTLVTTSRAWRPYPPGNVRVQSYPYGTWPTLTVGDLTLNWNHRNRISQGIGGALVAQDYAGTYMPEGTYTVEVLVGGVVKRTFTMISGTSQAYTGSQRVADDADGTKTVKLRIKPVYGDLTGQERTTPEMTMTGFGMTFGLNFGGVQQ